MTENKPTFFQRGGGLDRFLLRLNLVPKSIRNDMARAVDTGVIWNNILDSTKVDISGPGITDEDRELLAHYVMDESTSILLPNGVAEEEYKKKLGEKYGEFVDKLARQQKTAIDEEASGVKSTPLSDSYINSLANQSRRSSLKRHKETLKKYGGKI